MACVPVVKSNRHVLDIHVWSIPRDTTPRVEMTDEQNMIYDASLYIIGIRTTAHFRNKEASENVKKIDMELNC